MKTRLPDRLKAGFLTHAAEIQMEAVTLAAEGLLHDPREELFRIGIVAFKVTGAEMTQRLPYFVCPIYATVRHRFTSISFVGRFGRRVTITEEETTVEISDDEPDSDRMHPWGPK